MLIRQRGLPPFRPGLYLVLLVILLVALLVAGGASREDALGQTVVRGIAWLILIVAALFGKRPSLQHPGPVAVLLAASTLLALLQLVPLPPAIWQALPGRLLIAEAAAASGAGQPWRPWSIVPGATANAASSLIVPITVLVLLTALRPLERNWLPGLLLGLVVTAMLVGIAQFSGIGLDNPFVNEEVGGISGPFANYNHFALLLSFGLLLAPVWALQHGHFSPWRGAVALGLVALLTLVLLASGSRVGLGLGGLALALGLTLVQHPAREALGRYPRWAFPGAIIVTVGLVGLLVFVSIRADRAVSINRALSVDLWQDMRHLGLPTMLVMIRTYFPFGAGLGSFDRMFIIHEPFDLLAPQYFNHAHNDFIEVVLDAGLPGLLLLIAALVWWLRASFRAWHAGPSVRHASSKLGSAIILLVLFASVFDYPARTPIIMAVVVIAAVWLSHKNEINDPDVSESSHGVAQQPIPTALVPDVSRTMKLPESLLKANKTTREI